METVIHNSKDLPENVWEIIVVVDVYRAFTCLPLLFESGIEKAVLAATPEDAFGLKKDDPGLLLAGEVGGKPIKGFDLDNSPGNILRATPGFFNGKTVVQRTSSGVQKALTALDGAGEVFLGSYSLARATAAYILEGSKKRICIWPSGTEENQEYPEDKWCARYLEHLLGNGEYDHRRALREILFHEATRKFLHEGKSQFPPEDPILCLQRDIHDFTLKVARENELAVVRSIACGSLE